MQKVRILIVEDDMITATDLSQHLHRMGYDIVGIMTKAEDALQHLKKDPPDIILMDIQLRGMMNGIEAAKEIQQNHEEIIVIFLTANFDDETYNQAKLTKPQSFISKPFNYRELSRAIELAILNRQGNSKKDPDDLQGHELNASQKQENYVLSDRIFIRSKNKMIKIYIDDILYAEADRNYCIIYFNKGSHLLTMPLGALEEKLNIQKFIRVHRSFLVNINHIDELLDNYHYLSIDGKVIPVGNNFRENLISSINIL